MEGKLKAIPDSRHAPPDLNKPRRLSQRQRRILHLQDALSVFDPDLHYSPPANRDALREYPDGMTLTQKGYIAVGSVEEALRYIGELIEEERKT